MTTTIDGAWSVLRLRGERGLPALDAVQFLGCIASLRDVLADVRWHYRWAEDRKGMSRDGLRVELSYGTPELEELTREMEARIPPPDEVFAEPLRTAADLDSIQNPAEMEACLTLLWRYSQFAVDLRARNPRLRVAQLQALSAGALLTFTTGDRRHLENALDDAGIGAVPVVPLNRLVETAKAYPLRYCVPPADRKEAVDAVRTHHLAACTLSEQFYPFLRTS